MKILNSEPRLFSVESVFRPVCGGQGAVRQARRGWQWQGWDGRGERGVAGAAAEGVGRAQGHQGRGEHLHHAGEMETGNAADWSDYLMQC